MLGRIGRWIARVEDVCIAGSALALAAMMLLIVAEVVFRYLLGSPLGWTLGFVEDYLMVAFFFLAISYTFRVGGHVSIDLLVRRLPPKARRILAVVGNVLSLAFFALVCYAGILLTRGAWLNSEIPPPGGADLSWPTWTSYIFVPIGALVLALRLLHAVAGREEDISERSAETEA